MLDHCEVVRILVGSGIHEGRMSFATVVVPKCQGPPRIGKGTRATSTILGIQGTVWRLVVEDQ